MVRHHPDKDELECYAFGAAGVDRARWIEDHLRSGCPVCQPLVDSLLPGDPGDPGAHCDPPFHLPIDRQTTRHARGTKHLGRPENSPHPESPEVPESPESPENAAWERIFAKLDQRLAAIAAEREAAPQLLADLLEQPSGRQTVLVRECACFRNLALCDLLVEKVLADPGSAELASMADLGILVADHLDARAYGAAMVNDMRSRAWAALANARRLAGDLAGAERALDFAESMAEEGSADPLEEAKVLELRATLLCDQGWYAEAAGLIDSAVDIYEDVKDLQRMGRALIKKGLYLGLSGRPREAIAILPTGLQLIDPEVDHEVALLGRHHLAWFLNDCGDWQRADALLAEFRHLYAASGDSRAGLRLEWLEARIAQASRRFDEAEWRLRRLRQLLVEEGSGLDAAMVILDLARLYIDQGRPARLRRLGEEMQPIYLSRDLHQEAAHALQLFQRAVNADRITIPLLRQIARSMHRGRRDRSRPLEARWRTA